MKTKITLLVLIFSQFTFSQMVECVAGFAGAYPCNDYDLMSHLTRAEIGGTGGIANDSWGWTDSLTGKEYALICLANGTSFVDISDPVNPIYLGILPTATSSSSWRDVKVYNDYAFVVSEASGHGMQIFDLTKLRSTTPPETFSSDAVYTDFGRSHNIVINEDTGFAYSVGGDCSGGLHMINIQDPLNPINAGCFSADGYSHDAQCVVYNGPDTDHQGKEICFNSNEDTVTIVDVSIKNSPVQLSRNPYGGSSYTHQGWLTENHQYFIFGDELDEQNLGNNTKTYIMDVSDLDNPVLVGSYEGPSQAIDHNGYVKDGFYYLANYRAGMRVLDLANVATANLSEVGYFDTYPSNDNTNFNGAWNVYPYFESGNIIISDMNSGMYVVRKSNTLSTEEYSLNSFSIFPNPSQANTTIKMSGNTSIESISVNNLLGQTIFEFEPKDTMTSYKLDTSTFASGIYLVNINDKTTRKLVVE